jgi:hypothetical protein
MAASRALIQPDQPDPFIFPELPDEAAAALDQFLEDFYYQFQQRYGGHVSEPPRLDAERSRSAC